MTALRIILVALVSLASFWPQDATAAGPTVCLNMIVKNESAVIRRCLTSVLPLIDHWVIVDTGSSDGTQQIIRDFMQEQGVPGTLYERPWVDFAHNRNEALQLAQGCADYALFIDADEYLVYETGFQKPLLDKDYYYITIVYDAMRYGKIHLVNLHQPWQWVGVLHEVIAPPANSTFATLEKIHNVYTTEGNRSKDPQKYIRDAQILEAALLKEPDNARYVFYLAQSYRDGGNLSLALKNYDKRSTMGGWDQEVFWALLQVAILQEAMGMGPDVFVPSYVKAYQYRKTRIEPLYHLAKHFRIKEDFQSGYKIAKLAQTLQPSDDILFNQVWMYDYGLPFELSICAYWVGKYDECQQLCQALLKRDGLPNDLRHYVVHNLNMANGKLLEQICDDALATTAQRD